MTNSTTATLMTTSTPVTRLDSLVPRMSSSDRRSTMPTAAQSGRAASPASQLGRSSSCARYADHPRETTAAPSMSSSSRSQPMTQATNSPSVAYANVYADPATGTVDASSA